MNIFRPVWNRWLVFTKRLMRIQTLVLFSAFYFLILWIIGLFTRFFTDYLNIKNTRIKTTFVPWKYPVQTLEEAHKQ